MKFFKSTVNWYIYRLFVHVKGNFFLTQALYLPWRRFIQIQSKLFDVLFAVYFQSIVIGQLKWLAVGEVVNYLWQEIYIFYRIW